MRQNHFQWSVNDILERLWPSQSNDPFLMLPIKSKAVIKFKLDSSPSSDMRFHETSNFIVSFSSFGKMYSCMTDLVAAEDLAFSTNYWSARG